MKKFAIACLIVFAASCAAQNDNTFHVKQFAGLTVGAKVTAAMGSCNPNPSIPCYLIIDPSLAVNAPGVISGLCNHCIVLDYRSGNPGGTPYEGPVLMCDTFGGSDVSVRANNCVAAIISTGGGTIDLRKLLAGSTTGSEEIDIGTRASNSANIGITALFPTTGTYTSTIRGGPVTLADVYPGNGGTGYVTGDLVYPVETGWAYTGSATGAVLSVTASGGVVTHLTVVNPGSGYLDSKYVTTTTNGAGSGLIVNLIVADCAIRQNGSTTIQTGSVGGGATTFLITPSNQTGFVGQAGYCTDQLSGYVREEGGLKGANYTAGAYWSAAQIMIQGTTDASKFEDLEVSGPNDDGIRIDGACCGDGFYEPHSDLGDAVGAGYGFIVGSGGMIFNVCTSLGSPQIYAPYAHFTAQYLGDTLSYAYVGEPFPFSGTPVVTQINDFNHITVSSNATATDTGPMCDQTPNLTPVPPMYNGSGVSIRLLDPTQPAGLSQVNIYSGVFNESAAGLPNLLINSSVSGLNVMGAYLEGNSAIDNYTTFTYVARSANSINFYGLRAAGSSSSGTKYGVYSDTPSGWCVFGGIANAGFIDNNAVIPKSPVGNMTYCHGMNPQEFSFGNVAAASPTSASTAYLGKSGGTQTSITGKIIPVTVPLGCNVSAVQYGVQITGTLDTAAHYFQAMIYSNGSALTDTEATVASATLATNATASQTIINTPTDIVAPGSTLALQIVSPTFTTAPTGVYFTAQVECR